MTTFAGGGRCRENLLCTPSQLEPREPKRARKSASPETDEPTATACLTKQEVVIVRRAITSRYDASVSAAQHAIVSETRCFANGLKKVTAASPRRFLRRLRDHAGRRRRRQRRWRRRPVESRCLWNPSTPNDSFTVSTMEPRPASSVARRLFVVRREGRTRVRVVSSSFATNTWPLLPMKKRRSRSRRAVTVSRGFRASASVVVVSRRSFAAAADTTASFSRGAGRATRS